MYKRKRRKESNENEFVEAKGVKHFRKEAMINCYIQLQCKIRYRLLLFLRFGKGILN